MPFIVRWPGRAKPGTTTDQPASLTDLMATLAIRRGPWKYLDHGGSGGND